MPYFSKYHVREQSAPVLLDPIRAELQTLEARTQNYVARLNLDPGAEAPLRAAHAALQQARQELERIVRDARNTADAAQ